MSGRTSQIVTFGLAALIVVSAASTSLADPAGQRFAVEMEKLVQLTESLRTKHDARAQFEHLQKTAPSDSRVPYTYALLLIDQKRYKDASEPLKQALDLNGKDLDAWKTRIWLSVLIEDYDDALATMERLSRRMPATATSSETERVCCEFAGFMGQVFGYLSGPAAESVNPVKQTSSYQFITGNLSYRRQDVFDSLFENVTDNYTARMQEIEKLSEIARQGETTYRNLQLANLGEERAYARMESSRLEDLRANDRNRASNERNVQAAARKRAGHAFASVDDTHADSSLEFLPFPRPNPADPNGPAELDHVLDSYQNFDQHGAAAGAGFMKQGLDDRHYVDVNEREEKYHEYLLHKQKRLNQQQRRIASDEAQMLRRRVVGNSPEIMSAKNAAAALMTYVPMPVSPEAEVDRIIASYRAS